MVLNLLEETEKILSKFHKTWEDVVWIGNSQFQISVDNFKEVANQQYNNKGDASVAIDLLITGQDWWLERYCDEVSEGWSYREITKKPKEIRKVKSLIKEESFLHLEEMQ
jgi:hypothetical protein